MSNSRRFRPGRQAARQSLKSQVKARDLELARQRGINLGLQAQLSASKMERPADLEDWIREVALPDMSPEERAEWDAMNEDERETFLDQLGQRINATKLLAMAGGDESASPGASGTGS